MSTQGGNQNEAWKVKSPGNDTNDIKIGHYLETGWLVYERRDLGEPFAISKKRVALGMAVLLQAASL